MSELLTPTTRPIPSAAPSVPPIGRADDEPADLAPTALAVPAAALPVAELPGLTRRGFLRVSAVTGVGVAAAAVAACTPAGPGWTYPPSAASPIPSGQPGASPAASAGASPAASAGASASPMASHEPSASASPGASQAPVGEIPEGYSAHDVEARDKVRRYLGDLVPALQTIYGDAVYRKMQDILGPETDYPALHAKPAFVQVPQLVLTDALDPLTPTVDGDTKVFELTIDTFEQHIDELSPPIAALGYNGQWPGPTMRVNQGDRVRASFTNNLEETTGVHFHGVEFDDFFQDGVPFVTQKPIVPGETYTYDFVARNPGSLMYHSHHNATDQVGRGLLGAFIVDPPRPQTRYDREYLWISNDQLGGFTINGHGFPAVVPVLAAVGERVLIRFMNEGVMMHPWHSHGFAMELVARDGIPMGGAAHKADTFGVNPGERWDAVIEATRPGVWAFHCHILPHAEAMTGMFGMVSTLIVVPTAADVDAIVAALLA